MGTLPLTLVLFHSLHCLNLNIWVCEISISNTIVPHGVSTLLHPELSGVNDALNASMHGCMVCQQGQVPAYSCRLQKTLQLYMYGM